METTFTTGEIVLLSIIVLAFFVFMGFIMWLASRPVKQGKRVRANRKGYFDYPDYPDYPMYTYREETTTKYIPTESNTAEPDKASKLESVSNPTTYIPVSEPSTYSYEPSTYSYETGGGGDFGGGGSGGDWGGSSSYSDSDSDSNDSDGGGDGGD